MDGISSATDGMQCPWLSEVLQLVLQHVDLPQRLGPCALVCRAWRAAANAATDSVVVTAISQQQGATALSDWLQQHGGHVEQLQAKAAHANFSRPDLALPCDQLTKLTTLNVFGGQLRPINVGCGGNAEVSSSSSRASDSPNPQQQHPLAALTRLAKLRLKWLQWAGSLQPLSTLTNLRHLHLNRLVLVDDPPGNGASSTLDAAVGSAVSHLVQLTSLHIWACTISDAPLAHVSRLQQLQELQLGYLDLTPVGLAPLPQSLTWLYLVKVKDAVLSSRTQALAQLTALQHLQLIEVGKTEPMLLSHMAQLICFYLNEAFLVPAGSAGAAALLAAVARMTLLQHLELIDCLPESHAPATAYAALTASSHLTLLRVLDCSGYPLPAGALNHMFATGRQLPSLQNVFLEFKQEQQEQPVPNHLALRQQGFDQLLQCCSGLQSLDLSFSSDGDAEHQPPMKMDGLLAVSGLTRLVMDGLSVGEGGIANTLAQLTDLRQLMFPRLGIIYPVLLQLTELQQLERLFVFGQNGCNFKDEAPPGSPPDVWQQLQEWCVTRCHECAQLVLQQKDAQLQEARLSWLMPGSNWLNLGSS